MAIGDPEAAPSGTFDGFFDGFFGGEGGFMSGVPLPPLSVTGGPALATSSASSYISSNPVMSNQFVFGGSGAGVDTGSGTGTINTMLILGAVLLGAFLWLKTR